MWACGTSSLPSVIVAAVVSPLSSRVVARERKLLRPQILGRGTLWRGGFPAESAAPTQRKWKISLPLCDSMPFSLVATRTVKVSNISFAASERDIKEFFSFSGDIRYVEMQRESERSQLAYVTFKEPQGAETAMLLSGAKMVDMSVNIVLVEDYQLPPDAFTLAMEERKLPTTDLAIKKAEDVVSSMLAKGFVLGKDALNKAKALDERYNLISNASATVASLDCKIGLSEKISMGTAMVNEKVREVNRRFQVSGITMSALAAAEQKASTAGSALMSNPYVSTGAAWVSSAFNKVATAAGDVSVMTKEKLDRAHGEQEIATVSEPIHLEESLPGEPPIVPVNSSDEGKKL